MKVLGYWLMNVSGRREQASCGLVCEKPVEIVVVVDRLCPWLTFRTCHGFIVTNEGRTGNALTHAAAVHAVCHATNRRKGECIGSGNEAAEDGAPAPPAGRAPAEPAP
ncbi:MAG: hypothetical protein ACTHKG_21800 [Nocardioides sp.]